MLDLDSQAYFDAVMRNMENDKRRSRRQLAAFSSGDTEALVDSSEQSLLSPDADAVVPPLPPGFPWDHRPRFWNAFPRADTPKRERTEDDFSSDSEGVHRDPKRRASEKGGPAPVLEVSSRTPGDPRPLSSSPVDSASDVNPGSQAIVSLPAQPIASPYGTAPMSFPRVHYSLSLIMQNPLRHYPSVTSLYKGVLLDGTLLDLPVFPAALGSGETAKIFTRGEDDPAVCVLNAIGAQRVRADTLEFLTWSEKVLQPEIFYPFSDETDLFRVYAHAFRPDTFRPDLCVQFAHT